MPSPIDRALYDPLTWPALAERVYARSWLCLGLAPAPGRMSPVTLLPGVLDEPLLMVTSATGETRVFANVCTHRGAVLCTAAGPADGLRCPYHGRRFDLDGRVTAAPGFDVPPEEPLPTLPVRRVGPLVFTTLGDPADWPEGAAVLPDRLGAFDLAGLRHDPAGDEAYEVAAHPLLYVENYLEGMHIPFVHPALNRALDWRAYLTEPVPGGVLQVGLAAAGVPAFHPAPGHPDHGRAVAAWYLALFPATLLNYYPWGLSVNLVDPVDAGHVRIRYFRLVNRPELLGLGAGAGLDVVEAEDDQIVERVQRGVRSRLYRGGVLSDRWEVGVATFQAWVRARIR